MILAVIRTNNSVEIYDEKDFGLKFLQQIVGGWIEPVHLPDAGVMYVNEEGLIKNLPVNAIASMIVKLNGGDIPIHGNTIVCGPADEHGDETDLTMVGFELIAKAVSLAMIEADNTRRKN